jgi:GrpB-like predicted nucleotidyltransferase (UPF0157 family)
MMTSQPCQPDWPAHSAREAAALITLVPAFCGPKYIGSAVVPGLAAKPVTDIMAVYTRAKTSFVQELFDRVHDRHDLPRGEVWED